MSELERERRRARVALSGTETREEEQVLLEEEARSMLETMKELLRRSSTSRRFVYGQLTGIALAQVGFPTWRCDYGVIIKAHAGNAGMVYIGDSSVMNVGGLRVGGFELDANEAIILPVRVLEDLYMYDVPGGQLVSYIAM